MRVVAGAAANHNNHVRLGDQLSEGGLSVFRRLTDGIDESNIAIWDKRRRMQATICLTNSIGCVVCEITP